MISESSSWPSSPILRCSAGCMAFPQRYGVCAGEDLKDLAAFPKHVEHLLEIAAPLPQSRLSVVALGGGSVGDFAGFFASVFKRGVPLQQIPSTWLAAIDSAHGGKNALNVGRAKIRSEPSSLRRMSGSQSGAGLAARRAGPRSDGRAGQDRLFGWR